MLDFNSSKEKEIRFFFPFSQKERLLELVKTKLKAEFIGRFYEITTMYENPNPRYSFYSKSVDGRLRLKKTLYNETENLGSALLSWKRRLAHSENNHVCSEEEVEVKVNIEDFHNMEFIIENVLKCKRISSYERYRNILNTDKLQITIDEFCYGIVLEIEIKKDFNIEENLILTAVEKLKLNLAESSRLSCDDMYTKLCKEQNIKPLMHIRLNSNSNPILR